MVTPLSGPTLGPTNLVEAAELRYRPRIRRVQAWSSGRLLIFVTNKSVGGPGRAWEAFLLPLERRDPSRVCVEPNEGPREPRRGAHLGRRSTIEVARWSTALQSVPVSARQIIIRIPRLPARATGS